jgi:predicted Zn-dependent protease
MYEEDIEKLFKEASKDAYYLVALKDRDIDRIIIENNMIRELSYGKSTMATVDCYKDGKRSRSSGDDVTYDGILSLFSKSRNAVDSGAVTYGTPKMADGKFTYKDVGAESTDFDAIMHKMLSAASNLDTSSVMNSRILLEYGKKRVILANSSGGRGILENGYALGNVKIVLHKNKSFSSAVSLFSSNNAMNIDIKDAVNSAYNEARIMLEARRVAEFKGSIVLSPTASSKILTSVILALGAGYASTGKSFIGIGNEGKRIASPMVTLVERTNVPGSVFSRPFDDELIATTDKTIINEGILNTYLYDIGSAESLKKRSTGNHFNDSVYDISGVLYKGAFVTSASLKPGDTKFDDLIGSVRKGMYIMDIGFPNPINGRFTGNVKAAYIENGDVKYGIINPVMPADVSIMLNNIAGLSKETGQWGRISSPYVLIDNATIASQ